MKKKEEKKEGKKKDLPLSLGDLDRLNLAENDILLFTAKRRRRGEAEESEANKARREICTVLGIGSSSIVLLMFVMFSSIDGYPQLADCDD